MVRDGAVPETPSTAEVKKELDLTADDVPQTPSHDDVKNQDITSCPRRSPRIRVENDGSSPFKGTQKATSAPKI